MSIEALLKAELERIILEATPDLRLKKGETQRLVFIATKRTFGPASSAENQRCYALVALNMDCIIDIADGFDPDLEPCFKALLDIPSVELSGHRINISLIGTDGSDIGDYDRFRRERLRLRCEYFLVGSEDQTRARNIETVVAVGGPETVVLS